MGLFGGECAQCADMRAQRDRAQQELSALLSEHAALMKDVMAIKRHELGLPPAGFEPKDPSAVLGPKTKAAIVQMAGDYTDLTTHLTNWAIGQVNGLIAMQKDPADADELIAHMIRMGDTE